MSDDDNHSEIEPEVVRIIGADEAAEVLEREDVARRRAPGEPRPGDRPAPASGGGEPVLRFPLPSGDQPDDELPHWTQPPAGGFAEGGTIFDEPDPTSSTAWAGGSSPRWRDEGGEDWTDEVRALADDDSRVGALAGDQPDPEDFFRFDEIDGASETRSVFGEDVAFDDDDYDDEYEDEFVAEETGPRRIVVGGGRVTPGAPVRPPSTAGVGGDRDIGMAAMVGVGFLVVAAAAFAIGPGAAAVLVTIVVTMAAAEFLAKLREVGYQPAALLGVAGTAGMVAATYYRGESAIPVAMTLIVACSMLWYLIGAGEGQATLNIGVTLLAVGWVGMFGSFATAMLGVHGGVGVGDAGKGILFGAILGTVGYDVGGYFVGRSAGRSPLSAASPNKTVEGLLGGCIAAMTISVIYGFLSQPFGSLGDGLSLGVAVAVAAPLGDLCQSRIKRDLGIKDMGSILPGHGGFMDRFDALLFVLPAVYYVAKLSDFFL